MRLLADRIMVKPITEEEVRASGIILPNKEKKYPTALIKMIGNKVKHLKEGDTIMYYTHHQGTPINYMGEDYLLLSEGRDVISTL